MIQQKQLLQKMEEATTIVRTLKEERDAAFTRISTLEHDNREIQALLTLVEAKVEEMLSAGSAATRTVGTVPPAPTQRKAESPAAPVQQKVEMPVPPPERRPETPVASVRPEAEAKAPPADRAQDKGENVAIPRPIEEKVAPKGFTDLKERLRRPFP